MHDQDIRKLVELRKGIDELLEEARDAWWKSRKYREAAARLCAGLRALQEMERVFDELQNNLPDHQSTYADNLEDLFHRVDEVLEKIGVSPREASRIKEDLVNALGETGAGRSGAQLLNAVSRAADKVCAESEKPGGPARLTFMSVKGAALVSGVVIASVGVVGGEATLVLVGSGMVVQNAGLIAEGIDRMFK